MGIEWVNDTTCVFVFQSSTLARSARQALCKDQEQAEDEEGFVTAKGLPLDLWPIEERLNQVLGKSKGLTGQIRMRWARAGDMKEKGAAKKSEFYKKHGETAGKEGPEPPFGRKRQRAEPADDYEQKKARLDAELDSFGGRDDERGQDGGPIKLRDRMSDASDAHAQRAELDAELDSFLSTDQRGSHSRARSPSSRPIGSRSPSRIPSTSLATRLALDPAMASTEQSSAYQSRSIARLPRRSGRSSANGHRERGRDSDRNRDRTRRREPGDERPRKDKQDLDDELDAFLRERDVSI